MVSVRPWASAKQPQNCEVLVLNIGKDILGADLVLGTPELNQLRASINFSSDGLTLTWDKHGARTVGSSRHTERDLMDTNILATTSTSLASHKEHMSQASTQSTQLPGSHDPEITREQVTIEPHSLNSHHNLNKLIECYKDVFARKLNGSTMNVPPAQVQLTTAEPVTCRYRPRCQEEIREIGEALEHLHTNGIIEPSISPYSANCRLVPKKNGKQRLIINYMKLNSVTVRDEYPIPNISEIMGALQGHKIFSVLDATEGFHQLKMDERNRHVTAFTTPFRSFQYTRVPFGMTNSPAIFQRAINSVLVSGLYKKWCAYIDDIIVFGRTQAEHDANLRWVLDKCRQANLKINPAKCQLSKPEVIFLGRRINEQGISPSHDDLDAIAVIKHPKSKEGIRAALGSLQFLSRFIPNYSELTKPLVELTCKEAEFRWGDDEHKTLQNIIAHLQAAKPQVIPSRNSQKTVDLYVMPQSVEAICLDSKGNLIDRASRLLGPSERNYTRVERNLLALILACEKFEPIIDDKKTIFVTDSAALVGEMKLINPARRVEKLLLQLPPSIQPQLMLRDSNHHELFTRYAEVPPDATFYTDGASTSNGKEGCRAS